MPWPIAWCCRVMGDVGPGRQRGPGDGIALRRRRPGGLRAGPGDTRGDGRDLPHRQSGRARRGPRAHPSEGRGRTRLRSCVPRAGGIPLLRSDDRGPSGGVSCGGRAAVRRIAPAGKTGETVMVRSPDMETPPAQGLAARPRPAMHRATVPGLLIVLAIVSAVASILAADWIPVIAIWLLWAGWRLTRTGDGPPVLAMAFTFQWVQVTAGIWYQMLTGIRLPAVDHSDYRTMVLIGLGCLAALLAGPEARNDRHSTAACDGHRPGPALGWGALVAAYLASVVMTGTIQEFAWELPVLTQGILALTYIRFALLFLIFRRLSQPRIRLSWIALLLAGEIALGFTGYFAGFREPMMMAAMVLTGAFDRRKVTHWVVLGALGIAMLFTGVIWMGIRSEYRRDFEDQVFARSREARLDRISALSSKWLGHSPGEMLSDFDAFVDRLWAIYYPALALDRVPAVTPHEDGEILWAAVVHVLTPRLLFPDKPRRRVGQREGAPIHRHLGGRGRGEYQHRVRLCRGVVRRLRRAADVPSRVRLWVLDGHGLPRPPPPDPAPRARHRQRHRDLLAVALPLRALVGQHARAVADAHRVSRGRDVPGRPPAPGPRGDRQSAGARTARGAAAPGADRPAGPHAGAAARAARDAVLRAGLRLRRTAAQHPRALSGSRSRRGPGAGVHDDRQWPRELARLLLGGRSTRRRRRAVLPARVPPPALRRRRPRAGARRLSSGSTISCTRTGSGTGRGGRRRVMRGGG